MSENESFERACKETFSLIKGWEKDGLVTHECIYAGLSIFLRSAYELAPSKKAFFGMLANCMGAAYKEPLEEEEGKEE